MKNEDIQKNELLSSRVLSRREMLKRSAWVTGGVTAGFALGACGTGNSNADDDMDIAVLNFALNLEYLEAEYYLRAVRGSGLSSADRGTGAAGVTGGRKVSFSNALIRDYANEIAADEEHHVQFLRSALGDQAVSAPAISLDTSFAALGFDPFENEFNFLLGAFVFEDVGVTAYNGGATLLSNKTYLGAAASILAVEAYHAANVRTAIIGLGQTNRSLIDTAQKISDARDAVNAGVDKDQGVTLGSASNVVPTDESGLAFARSTTEVLNIVYLNANTTPGGFFPNGLNGQVR